MIQEVALDKKGKEIKDEKGNKQYKRDDFIGLINLLNAFDTKIHDMKDYKMFLKLKDHIFANWVKENKTLELSLDEATFLRDYLSSFSEKEGKNISLPEFMLRTLCGVLEQIE
jgi:hypothetical protein